jgi:hypothetical protein
MGTRSETRILTDLNIATRDFMKGVVSQLNNDNYLSSRLMGKSEAFPGGERISVPLQYGRENTQTLSDHARYNLQPKEILDYAYYEIKHINGDMAIGQKRLMVQNTGKAADIKLARTRSENLAESMRRQFSDLLYTPVADLKATDPDSLIKICATENNTVGGIDGSTHTSTSGNFDWNPHILDYSSAGITFDNLTDPEHTYYIINILQRLVGPLTMGADSPTIGLTNQAVWDAYENVLRDQKQFDQYYEADGGFETLKFRKMKLAVDNGMPGGQENTVSANGAMIIALNEKYVGYQHAPAMNFKWTPWKKKEDETIYFSLLDWMGGFVCSRRDRQGAVLGLPTDAQVYV